MKEFVKNIEDLVSRCEDRKVEKAVTALLAYYPDDVYLLSQLAGSLLYQDKNEEGLACILKAEELNKDFPLVPYYKGKLLMCLDRCKESIECWDCLLSMDDRAAVAEDYGINAKRLRQLKNDALYYKGSCYYCLFCVDEAEKYISMHLAGRRKGMKSDVTKKKVTDFLRQLRYTSRKPAGRCQVAGTAGILTIAQGNRLLHFLNKIKKEGDTKRVLRYYRRKTREYPNDYYLWTLFSEYCYDHRLKEECLASAARAYALVDNRDDMQVLYDYASALYLNCRWSDAVAVLDDLLSRDINFIAYGEHGEGMTWAKALVRHAAKIREDCTCRMNDPTEALKTIKL